ncbi:hypothetical protein EEL30_00795 (plasmid) [Brevibacillus laterosporus]|uniref:Uncharacterized protein n=1 Tax=Brevibacillus laterosporus TaxID=1465 RepID=A0A518V229_BRELA|nr:hypothetical protein EEL30_00795 [Brevibacillus laterosporus]
MKSYQAKNFKFLDTQKFGNPAVYFAENIMKSSCLVAIPAWNWSYLIDYEIDFKVSLGQMSESLKGYMFDYEAEEFSNILYQYALNEMK